MQEIVFYVAAKETCGIVRNSANSDNLFAPNLVIGVSVCLKMRLFTACDDSTPYPIGAFVGIADWSWNMNPGYSRNGEVKLTADQDGITVHSVTDTIDGNTLTFTEFVIPISDMNTQEFSEWFGSEEEKTELNGELVGYDNAGNAVFVLQVKNFTIWNRVGGLCDPTAVEQEIATRSQTLQWIRDAVSSSAATKQDKLTSANAGTGISISENGIISNTYSIPSATADAVGGVMLATAAETISGTNTSKALTPASFMAAIAGDTQIVAHSALDAFQTITDFGTASSVSLESGGAYRLYAVSGDHFLTVPVVPAGKYGMDAHVELFVGVTTLMHVNEPLILMDALVPNAVNNCVIKFRDGTARMFVEDHAYGYVVTVSNGTAGTQIEGSLYCGLTGSTAGYVTFANTLNSQTIDLGGVATGPVEKRVVGNGYTQTILSGGVSCTSKTTFSNLGMNGVTVLDGTATLGDVFIGSGATVSVNGGGLAIEKVTGSGGTIDLGGYSLVPTNAVANGIKFVNISSGGVMSANGYSLAFTSCSFTNAQGTNAGDVFFLFGGTKAFFGSCTFSGNANAPVYLYGNNTSNGSLLATFSDCKLLDSNAIAIRDKSAQVCFAGSNVLTGVIWGAGVSSGTVLISSGAVVDLTGNTNATPINPGGGIVASSGGFTLLYTSGGSAQTGYVGGGTFAQIASGGVLGGLSKSVVVDSGVWSAANVTFTRAEAGADIITLNGGNLNLTSVGGYETGNGRFLGIYGGTATLAGCSTGAGASLTFYANGGTLVLTGSNHIGRGVTHATGVSGTLVIAAGATVDEQAAFLPIDPGGPIHLPARPEGAPVTVLYGSNDDMRTFRELEIHGSTISQLGIIFGATVTIPDDLEGTYYIMTTEGTTSVTSADAGEYVISSGGLIGTDKD